MKEGNNICGAHGWYHIKNNEYETSEEEKPDTDLPIVPYELWKQNVTTPDNQVEQPAGRTWKVGDRYCNPVGTYKDIDVPNTEGWYIRQLSKDTYKMETVDGEDKMSRYSYTAKKIDDYVNRRIWVPYVKKKESTVKENTVPIGWRPGDSWRHKNNDCGLSISVHPKDGDSNMYFINYGENGTAWVEVKVINEFVREGLWIINPSQKGRQEEKQEQKEEKQSQTIINKQSKTKQNENIKEGISISTEQCIVISSNYINSKTSNATYVPGDEERITKGQRRQGFTVRG
jgi:hypothetical protein